MGWVQEGEEGGGRIGDRSEGMWKGEESNKGLGGEGEVLGVREGVRGGIRGEVGGVSRGYDSMQESYGAAAAQSSESLL